MLCCFTFFALAIDTGFLAGGPTLKADFVCEQLDFEEDAT
jgi:hypothetical protein